MDIAVTADHRVKIKVSEKWDNYLDIARELKKMEYEGDCDYSCNCCTWNESQGIGQGMGKIGN